MKKLIFLLLLFSNSLFAQDVDTEFMFKNFLFLDALLVWNDPNGYKIKNREFANLYYDGLLLDLDTLYHKENFLLVSYKPKPSNLIIKDERANSVFIGNNCEEYLILFFGSDAFRLKGFDHNDFQELLFRLKRSQSYSSYPVKINKRYFKKLKIPNLDFDCLYRSLRAKEYDPEKYPCLQRCSDMVVVY